LGDEWHLGYSNGRSLANIFDFVNIFCVIQNIFVFTKLFWNFSPNPLPKGVCLPFENKKAPPKMTGL